MIIVFPLLMGKYLSLLTELSIYLSIYHKEFYEKHKSFSRYGSGRIVSIQMIPDKFIMDLNDEKVSLYKKEIRQTVKLSMLAFLITILLCVFIICY